MSFKDEIADDLAIFLDEEEFAETHNIEGKDVVCIVDDDALQEQKIKSATGTYTGKKLIHVKGTALEGRPAVDGKLFFDGKPYTVKDCIDNNGMLSITLDIIKA